MKDKQLKAPGEFDYDFKYDILFFKVKNREYSRSIEAGNFILDIDSEDFLTGVQIPGASRLFGIDKMKLMKVPNWNFEGRINDGMLMLKLAFQVQLRNKIIEPRPIIFQEAPIGLPNSKLICN